MNFIKKIFDGQVNDSVHQQFQKFSRGEFKDRAVINARKSKNKYSISTSSEFVNELVKIVAEKLGEEKTMVTGAIISTSDLTGEIEFKEKKQFQGVKKYLMESEMSGLEILNLLEKFPKSFFALTFSSPDGTKLKTKPKAPKSGKPGKGGEEPKADFCKIITTDSNIGKSFVFEKDDFKKADIKHIFVIDKIIMPEGDEHQNGASEKDFAKIREMAKRGGKIIRIANIDGEKTRREVEFEA